MKKVSHVLKRQPPAETRDFFLSNTKDHTVKLKMFLCNSEVCFQPVVPAAVRGPLQVK